MGPLTRVAHHQDPCPDGQGFCVPRRLRWKNEALEPGRDPVPAASSDTSYWWEVKGVVPILKVDKGLLDDVDGARLMKPMRTCPQYWNGPGPSTYSARRCGPL